MDSELDIGVEPGLLPQPDLARRIRSAPARRDVVRAGTGRAPQALPTSAVSEPAPTPAKETR
ncbi:hypothetical protein [Amycolatopsis sp. NBC_01286]|uniref:hypothetical protein n=1 Tax=Amycolatopsis sp. NBC_01286 TaxID=2903560 RepID=UPI002E14080C|nr:hypothetical protein OG570_19240 [Amycolatopsis sp. NBC_01286]